MGQERFFSFDIHPWYRSVSNGDEESGRGIAQKKAPAPSLRHIWCVAKYIHDFSSGEAINKVSSFKLDCKMSLKLMLGIF